jgi:ribosome-associated protein
MDTLEISDKILIPMSAIQMTAIRSQGPGGQNVNKVSSAIHLRFDVAGSSALPQTVKDRLILILGRRLTSDGVLIVKSQRYRTRERNRQAALERLRELIAAGLPEPEVRIPTRPSKRAQQKRLNAKSRRSELKRSRGKVVND